MKEAEVLLDHLLPIDGEVQWSGVQAYATGIGAAEPLKNVWTLPYPEDTSDAHILLDGHHTAKAARIRGLIAVRATVLVDDSELAAYVAKERWWWPAMKTKEELRERYRTDWATRMERLGIVSIDDVPEVIHEPRSYRRQHDLMSIPVDREGNPIR